MLGPLRNRSCRTERRRLYRRFMGCGAGRESLTVPPSTPITHGGTARRSPGSWWGALWTDRCFMSTLIYRRARIFSTQILSLFKRGSVLALMKLRVNFWSVLQTQHGFLMRFSDFVWDFARFYRHIVNFCSALQTLWTFLISSTGSVWSLPNSTGSVWVFGQFYLLTLIFLSVRQAQCEFLLSSTSSVRIIFQIYGFS